MKEPNVSDRQAYWAAILELDKDLKEREEKLKKFKSCPLRDWLEVNAFKIYTTIKDLEYCLNYLEENGHRYGLDDDMRELFGFANATLYKKLLHKKYSKIYFGKLV